MVSSETTPRTPVTLTLIQAVTRALQDAMTDDDRVVILGEDVGQTGGVFRATEGLQQQFGEQRVMDAPLSETGIVGAAMGMAINGLRPVAEIQFADYTFPAFDQITSEVAKLRYRSGGDYSCPLVIRAPYGGGIRGGHFHSQSPEAYYTHTPGLTVVIPSTPADAYGLLRSALQGEDPVLFLEPKRLYRAVKQTLLPEALKPVPIGPAHCVQPGNDVTVLCYGAMVPLCEQAASRIQQNQVATVELLDLRTLNPVDEDSILASVRKTGRVVIVHEAPKTCGYGAELAALIAEQALDVLEAPIRRVAGYDTPYPYSLEGLYYPTVERIEAALADVLAYQ